MLTIEAIPACFKRRAVRVSAIAAVVATSVIFATTVLAVDDQQSKDDIAEGADLFAREWLPNDPKAPGGDGLGPFYNETSCIACHQQGGPGGAGPTSTNVEIVRAGPGGRVELNLGGADRAPQSIVLHRFGVDGMYRAWRLKVLGLERLTDRVESPETEMEFVRRLVTSQSMMERITVTQRNPPPLFGAGLIDALSEDVLLAAEKQVFSAFPEVRG
jgi:hypothetical protein